MSAPDEYVVQPQAAEYAYWQRRIMLSTIVGYALYYFVRKNLSVAMPVMETELGISKSKLGLFLTAHGVLYGVSKFFHGIIGDRVNARWFMTSGSPVTTKGTSLPRKKRS